MEYLCEKQISIGGRTYCPGEIIPDGVVLGSRSGKLRNNGYISEIRTGVDVADLRAGVAELYTKEEVAAMVAEALAEAEKESADRLAELQAHTAELSEPVPGVWEGTVQIPVKNASNGEREQISVVFAKPEEIQQAFSILQMNAEEGAKEISGVDSENVLILLHASDSRVTIKNAAKKRADNLFLTDDEKSAAEGGKQFTEGIAKDEGVMDSRGGDD